MTSRRILLAAGAAACLAPPRQAGAQANIRPSPTPRLPPQPGQGLPLEERRFLRDAAALSQAVADASGAVAARIAEGDVRRLAEALAMRHRRLVEAIRALGSARGLDAASPLPEAEAPTNPQVAAALARLRAVRTEGNVGEREFLAAQRDIHPVLVEMYQTEASHSLDRELGRFAITSLVGIQEEFAEVVRLGERLGLPRPEGLLANPPQYGPGAGPPR